MKPRKHERSCCSRPMAACQYNNGHYRRRAYLCGVCGRLEDARGNVIWPARKGIRKLARAVVREVKRKCNSS